MGGTQSPDSRTNCAPEPISAEILILVLVKLAEKFRRCQPVIKCGFITSPNSCIDVDLGLPIDPSLVALCFVTVYRVPGLARGLGARRVVIYGAPTLASEGVAFPAKLEHKKLLNAHGKPVRPMFYVGDY